MQIKEKTITPTATLRHEIIQNNQLTMIQFVIYKVNTENCQPTQTIRLLEVK
jgi:uncharacterized lipoprotein YbaY